MLICYSGIAQLVEHLTVNQVVVSSSLTAGATKAAGEFFISRFFIEWGILMDILYLTLCVVFMVIGIQFTRGKWLRLLVGHGKQSQEELKKPELIIAPGLIGLGLSMFFLGFFDSRSWDNIGNAIFVLSVAYLVGTVILAYIRFGRGK